MRVHEAGPGSVRKPTQNPETTAARWGFLVTGARQALRRACRSGISASNSQAASRRAGRCGSGRRHRLRGGRRPRTSRARRYLRELGAGLPCRRGRPLPAAAAPGHSLVFRSSDRSVTTPRVRRGAERIPSEVSGNAADRPLTCSAALCLGISSATERSATTASSVSLSSSETSPSSTLA